MVILDTNAENFEDGMASATRLLNEGCSALDEGHFLKGVGLGVVGIGRGLLGIVRHPISAVMDLAETDGSPDVEEPEFNDKTPMEKRAQLRALGLSQKVLKKIPDALLERICVWDGSLEFQDPKAYDGICTALEAICKSLKKKVKQARALMKSAERGDGVAAEEVEAAQVQLENRKQRYRVLKDFIILHLHGCRPYEPITAMAKKSMCLLRSEGSGGCSDAAERE